MKLRHRMQYLSSAESFLILAEKFLHLSIPVVVFLMTIPCQILLQLLLGLKEILIVFVSGVHTIRYLEIDKRKHDGLECGIGLVLMPETIVAVLEGLLHLLLLDLKGGDSLLQIGPGSVYKF